MKMQEFCFINVHDIKTCNKLLEITHRVVIIISHVTIPNNLKSIPSGILLLKCIKRKFLVVFIKLHI